MPTPRSVCLVSPHHLSNNPRLVKEATALHASGLAVTVIHGLVQPHLASEDAAIASAHGWYAQPVDWRRRARSLLAEMNHRIARVLLRGLRTPSLSLAARAEHRALHALAAAARGVHASLYIGHTPAGLCAAAAAAHRNQGLLGFDAEDFHPAETGCVVQDAWRRRGLHTIESNLLPSCASLTASSPLISERYASAYGVRAPTVVLNAFPRSQAPASPQAAVRDNSRRPRLYWFSQTIGHGRGLEELVLVLGRTRNRCDLFLRGTPENGFVDALQRQAARARFGGRIHLLPRAPSSEMVRLCAPYDLGLALEKPVPLNRDLCLTNKLFAYLLAGLPLAYTPTRAQRSFAATLGPAAMQLDLLEPDAAAAALDAFLDDVPRQQQSRAHAWSLGHGSHCWEVEQRTLIAEVNAALARPARLIPRI